MVQKKKTLFIFYPFVGIYSMLKWTILGIYTTLMAIGKSIVDIFSYALKGLLYVFVTIPKKAFGKNKTIVEEIEPLNFETKAEKIDDLLKRMPQKESLSENGLYDAELPMLDTTKSIAEAIVSNNSINSKNKKQIIKERKEKFKKEEKAKKQLSKKQKAKLMAEKESLLNDLASGDVKRSEKPIAFRYKAIDPTGKIVKGTFTGSSKLDVNAFLVNEGYDVYSIETSNMINFLYGQSSFGVAKMSTKDLIFWLTQLHTYVKSGIPLTDSVKILSNQMGRNGRRKKIFEKIIYELTMGSSFSDALAKQGEVFPSLLINMLKAAEATGELEETLEDMANYYSETEKTRKQMISAMTYPSIIVVFSAAVVSFILLYVIPQFTKIYEQSGIQINGLTQAIINFSNFLKANFSFILLGVALIALIIFVSYKKIKFVRKNLQILLMHIPVVGKIIIYNEMTMFTKTFASLLKNNVFITESVEILSKVTNNEVYKEIMYNTITNIARGDKISESFKDQWAIPDVAYYMIVTGESTGELASMMANVSNYYQEQHRSIVNNLKAFIEPIMIVGLAVVVGGIIMAVIIPMFDLYSNISM